MLCELESHAKQYVFMTDFDQTVSFNDSGLVLSEILGISGFARRVAGLSKTHLGSAGRRACLPAAARPRLPELSRRWLP
jgi:hypothetical protein